MKINEAKTQFWPIPGILLIAASLVISMVLGLWQVKPPRVDEISPNYPAYLRMIENIQRLAVEPHVTGSPEIEIIREEILVEIEGMGLTPVVEKEVYTPSEFGDVMMWWSGTTREEWWEWAGAEIEKEYGIHSFDDWYASIVQENIVLQNIHVKLDTPDTDHGILFISHYDSTDGGPGAADDMLSVCAMLEAIRAHARNSELKTDLYFLFTDSEENKMLGAWKFVKAHPELKDKIDMAINLEARGNRGGLLLFQTSPQAYSLLKTVVKSSAKPIGFSWTAAVYAEMPNYTDFSVFLDAGYKGVNFAAIEGVETYHQPTDTPENLNPSTAWQYLLTTLALADYAAEHSLDELRQPSQDAVYFSFLPGVLVLMKSWVSHILCVAACVLALFPGLIQVKNKQLKVSFSTILMGLLALLSIGSAIFFVAGSYLFYIPLLVMVITAFLKKWKIAYIVSQLLSGVIVLLLWVPVIYLLWVSMIQPIIL